MTEREILNQLRNKRIESQLTLREAAEGANLLPSTIWRIETGQSKAFLYTVLTYANSLGMTIQLIPNEPRI